MVDDESVVEVLMWKAFKEISLDENQLKPTRSIYGFANQPIRAKGIITLSVTLDQREHTVIVTVDFLVVDQLSAYNAIIGYPLIKKISMVMTVYCLTVKFLTSIESGISRWTTQQLGNTIFNLCS